MAVTRLFGASVKRREDPRLITGHGAFTDDVKLPGMAYMAILRSPYGHARIKSLDATRGARSYPASSPSSPAADLAGQAQPDSLRLADPRLRPQDPAISRRWLTDTVRFTGDGVAAVVATSSLHCP